MTRTTTTPSGLLRVLIADDHEMARAGLRSLLSGEAWIQIVGEVVDGRQAAERCSELMPDLALLDVRMPHMDGLTATQVIKRAHPQIKVVIVTMHEDLDYLVEAIKAGAAGYVLKDATRREMLAAIRQVSHGETFMPPQLMAQALRRFATEVTAPSLPLVEALTQREMDVLRQLVQGQTNRQIGAHLSISPGTVKVHVERIIAKLGVSDRTQAAVRAIELHLV